MNQIYKQIGNAVPVNLSRAIAKQVIDVLQD
jgi:site-specific DNA-cytosine methylase